MRSSLLSRPGFRTAAMAALLAAGTVLLFSRAIGYEFLNYDDPGYVTDNPHVQGGLAWSGIAWAFTAPADYWHPLTWLTHMLDWQLYGSDAAGHHLTSVLWHALNAALAFLVFQRLAGGWWRSAFAAALFAWHPLRVESVAWITERKDVMSGCFFFLTLLAYAHYAVARDTGRPAWRRYTATLALFAAGLMSKPMLVSLPLVLLILDFWPLARGARGWRPLLLEKLPFFALAGATALLTIAMQRQADAFVLTLPADARIDNAVVSLARYLGKFIRPVDLIVCYPHPGYWPALAVVGAAMLALALGALAWGQRRRRPWIAAGLAWYLVTLLPVLGLVQVGFQAMADRYTYLPLLGIELALIWSIPAVTSRAARIAYAGGAAAILAAGAMRTWNQEAVWRDSVSLFEHAVQVDDRNDTAEDFLASALFAAGRFDAAATHAARAHALNPRNDKPLISLAGVAEKQGRLDDAIAFYRSALAVRPANPSVQCQLGLLELRRGHAERARELMTAAFHSAPPTRARTREIAQAAWQHGDTATAGALFELLVSFAAEDTDAQAGLGLAWLARRDPARALPHLRIAATRQPAAADLELALAETAEQLGEPAEAETALARAVAAAPDHPLVLSRAADFHARRRDLPAAVALYRQVVALAPGDVPAHTALGFLLIATGDRAGGLAEWRRALELNPNLPKLRDRLQQEEKTIGNYPKK